MTARKITSAIESDRGDHISMFLSEYVRKPRNDASQAAAEDTKEVMERHRKELQDAIYRVTKNA